MSEIQRDEFEQWMRLLRDDIQGVHLRLDGLNGRTRTVENKVSVLEDRGVRTTDPTARWGAGVAGAIALVAEIARRMFGSQP